MSPAVAPQVAQPRSDGGHLLDDLVAILRRFLVLPTHAPEAMALWVAHTYAIDSFYFSPRLVLTSPIMRCGKSTTLLLIRSLVCRPLMASNASSASIFRVMAADHPTLLMDEADGWLVGDSDIRTVLNGGFSRSTSTVLRVDLDTFKTASFDSFGAMGIALIGEPAATVMDRSVVIQLKRKGRADRVEKLRGASIEAELRPVRDRLARWIDQVRPVLVKAEPEVPEDLKLDDRASDLWEPLLAIADEAGGDWPNRARTAAMHLSAQRLDGETDMRLRLLEDLRSVIAELLGTRFSSAHLLEELVHIEGSPWSDWQRGRPLTSRGLADLLRPFRLTPVTVRLPGGSTPKGYKREDLEHLFGLYLDSPN